jgi:hypothetical protein
LWDWRPGGKQRKDGTEREDPTFQLCLQKSYLEERESPPQRQLCFLWAVRTRVEKQYRSRLSHIKLEQHSVYWLVTCVQSEPGLPA